MPDRYCITFEPKLIFTNPHPHHPKLASQIFEGGWPPWARLLLGQRLYWVSEILGIRNIGNQKQKNRNIGYQKYWVSAISGFRNIGYRKYQVSEILGIRNIRYQKYRVSDVLVTRNIRYHKYRVSEI